MLPGGRSFARKTIPYLFLLAVTGLAVPGCTDDGGPAEPTVGPALTPTASFASTAASRVIPGSYIVVFKPEVSDAPGLAQRLVDGHGGSLRFTYAAALKGFAADLPEQALEALRRNPSVSYVEADQAVELFGTETPPPSWGLDRVDQRTLPLDASYTYGGTGAGVNVYIIDTGIRSTHVEFGGRALGAYSSVKGKYSTDDCHGHGTHVAGTVGGSTYGVAKAVKLYGVRVLDCTGSGTWSAVIAGIDWVTANHLNPAVANMSLGGTYMQAVNDAVESSIRSGVTYAVAAGNSASNACNYSPASAPDALTVGATDSLDQQTWFSNMGPCLDLYGPGLRIRSAWIGSDTDGRAISGTSMASPHVAGTAALYLETHPTAVPADVGQALAAAATAGQITKIGTGSPNLLLFTGDPAAPQPTEPGGGGGSAPCQPKQAWSKNCK
jgi:subtilisin family serine protease